VLKRRHFNALLSLPLLTGSLVTVNAQTTDTAAVLVIGDSLTAEYGLKRGSGWVQILQDRVVKQRMPVRMVNAGISADTSSGGRSRLPALLKLHKPAVVVIELGANDALRGLPLSMTRDNLTAMARAAKAAGAKVVIVGMQVPPNYGGQYTRDFRDLFPQVATAEKAALVPFLLKGVADLPDPTLLFQEDRIHPNETAQATIADNVWQVLLPLLPKR
jgi:acyl-CoA thioesterase I